MLSGYLATSDRVFGNPIFADDLFCDLPPKALEALARIKRRKRFQKGILIVNAGEMPSGFYILRAGQARLFLNAESTKLLIARPIKLNEYLGLTETIAGLPYKKSIVTVAPCLCEFIEREDFINFLQDESEACFRLARFLGFQLNKKYQLLSTPLL